MQPFCRHETLSLELRWATTRAAYYRANLDHQAKLAEPSPTYTAHLERGLAREQLRSDRIVAAQVRLARPFGERRAAVRVPGVHLYGEVGR